MGFGGSSQGSTTHWGDLQSPVTCLMKKRQAASGQGASAEGRNLELQSPRAGCGGPLEQALHPQGLPLPIRNTRTRPVSKSSPSCCASGSLPPARDKHCMLTLLFYLLRRTASFDVTPERRVTSGAQGKPPGWPVGSRIGRALPQVPLRPFCSDTGGVWKGMGAPCWWRWPPLRCPPSLSSPAWCLQTQSADSEQAAGCTGVCSSGQASQGWSLGREWDLQMQFLRDDSEGRGHWWHWQWVGAGVRPDGFYSLY